MPASERNTTAAPANHRAEMLVFLFELVSSAYPLACLSVAILSGAFTDEGEDKE